MTDLGRTSEVKTKLVNIGEDILLLSNSLHQRAPVKCKGRRAD